LAASSRDPRGSRATAARRPAHPHPARTHARAGSARAASARPAHARAGAAPETRKARPPKQQLRRSGGGGRGTGAPPVRLRLIGLLLAMVLAFGAIGVRLFQLQTRDTQHLSSLGLDQRVHTVTLPAERGSIFDRTGRVLAVSVPQTTIVADPKVIKDPMAAAAKLAPILNVDELALQAKLSAPGSRFAYVARKVDDGTVKKVKALHLAGLSYTPESKRYYPAGSLAAPLLGLVGTDNTGLGGIEYEFDKSMTGVAGQAQVERDPQGNDIPGGQHQVKPAQRGEDLVLTLDQSLQWNTEQALLQGVTSAGAKGGIAIVMDVQTGDILTMASVDGATDTEPAKVSSATESNRPVATVYEPGSTNKVITMSGAIQEGVVSPNTTFDDIYGQVNVGDATYKDAEDHPSTMSVTDILAYSSNVGTIKIARMLGATRFDQYLRAFGFGRTTGIGLPGEAAGTVFTTNQYNDTTLASSAIGYSVGVTALQMLDVYATIANGGMARPPRIVAATVDAQGNRHDEALAAPRQVVSASTAQQVTSMLKQVVNVGTGTKAAIPGYPVAGKTGTAAKAPYNTGQYMASFAGFAPADNPRLAAIVVMDAPTGSIFGADTAAPVFKQVMQFALTYERVPTSG
jgi:cell division protein FtsI/penicillin-binding protein 2